MFSFQCHFLVVGMQVTNRPYISGLQGLQIITDIYWWDFRPSPSILRCLYRGAFPARAHEALDSPRSKHSNSWRLSISDRLWYASEVGMQIVKFAKDDSFVLVFFWGGSSLMWEAISAGIPQKPQFIDVHWSVYFFFYLSPALDFRVSKSQITTSHAPQHAGPMKWRSLQWSSFACPVNAPRIAIPWRAPNEPTWRCASPCQRSRVHNLKLCVNFANIEATSGRRNQLEVTCSSMPPWTALPSFRSMLSGCGGSGGIGRPIHMSLFQAMSYQSSRSTGSGLSFQNLSLSWYCIMHSDTKKHSYSYSYHIMYCIHIQYTYRTHTHINTGI